MSRVRKPEMDQIQKNRLQKFLKNIMFMFKMIYLIIIVNYCFIFWCT